MGEYLSKPETKKSTEHGETQRLRYVVSAMQGWRRSMEDSHIADLNLGDGCSLFGVFDGHGGQEVALYVKKNYTKVLTGL